MKRTINVHIVLALGLGLTLAQLWLLGNVTPSPAAHAAWTNKLWTQGRGKCLFRTHYRTFFRVTTCRRAGSGRKATGNGWSSLSR